MNTASHPLSLWQWHGRYLALEARNGRRRPAVHHRVVYHLADVVEAPDGTTALAAVQARWPGTQTMGLRCLGPVRPEKQHKHFSHGSSTTTSNPLKK